MNLVGISLDQAPPISVPFRFFAIAPLFGIFTVVLLWLAGADVFSNRWNPWLLAATHSFILGFVVMIILGALFQLLPVMAGIVISNPHQLATRVLILWLLGSITLPLSFIVPDMNPYGFLVSGACLNLAVLLLIYAIMKAWLKNNINSNTSNTSLLTQPIFRISLALSGLIVTLGVGIILILGQSQIVDLWRPTGTNIHMAWGLIGWIGMLITAIAWQIVPMFQITPNYNNLIKEYMGIGLVCALLIFTVTSWFDIYPIFKNSSELMICFLLIIFAASTLWIQKNRRRKIPDTHIYYWRFGSIFLILAAMGWLWLFFTDYLVNSDTKILGLSYDQVKITIALLYILGFIVGTITGMLHKIMAFLVWLHIQGKSTEAMMAGKQVPNLPHMKNVIPESLSRIQWWLFVTALFSLLFAVYKESLFPLALMLWFTYFVLLAVVLIKAFLTYIKFDRLMI